MLSAKQIIRYEKHLDLPYFGENKQADLAKKTVSVIGAGGLGCPVALYLVSSGVGRLQIFDDDTVITSNLQRQILYTDSDIKKSKVATAKDALGKVNPFVTIDVFPEKVTQDNIDKLLSSDIVVDATDNFSIRYLLNEFCHANNIPLVSGSVLHYDGQVLVMNNRENNGCYQCLYPVKPEPGEVPSCQDSSVFCPLTGTIGTLMATEAIKTLLGIGSSLSGYILLYNALTVSFTKMEILKNGNCPTCGNS